MELKRILDDLEGQLIETLGDLDRKGSPFMAEEKALLRQRAQELYLLCRGLGEALAISAYQDEVREFPIRIESNA